MRSNGSLPSGTRNFLFLSTLLLIMRYFFQLTKLLIFILLWTLPSSTSALEFSDLQDLEQKYAEAISKKDHSTATSTSYEIAKIYLNKGQFDKAEEYLTRTTKYAKKSKDPTFLFSAHSLLGLIHSREKKYSKALDHYQDAVKAAKEIGKTELVNEGLLHVAETYGHLGKHKKSISPLEEVLSSALRQNDFSLQKTCYKLLADYHKKLGDLPKFTEYNNLYNHLVVSQQLEEFNHQQLKTLEEEIQQVGAEKKNVNIQLLQKSRILRQTEDSLLDVKYSLLEEKEINEKRKLEIDLLNKDKELAEIRISEQKAQLEYETWVRNSVLVGLFLATSLIGVMVSNYRKTLQANKKIEQQNTSIRSSINYAKRIQIAMLPDAQQQKKFLPHSFVFLKPRDVVSGDFYWLTEVKKGQEGEVIFAAADCTGHGVPGALMSMVGIKTLNGIVNRGIAAPQEVLETLDVEIRSSLQQDVSGVNDGMDVALCLYKKEQNILEFSGAKNPLIYIRNKELVQIKGTARAIGGQRGKKQISFKNHQIKIDQPTMVYLFSDGFVDQFGENNKGKFMVKRFHQLLLNIHLLPLTEQKEKLQTAFEEWKGKSNQIDDVLVLGIKLEPFRI